MKFVNFIILFAVSVANRVAHCKYLTVDVSKSESYGDINVTRHDISSDAYSLIYWVRNSVDDINKIVDGSLVLTRNNKLIGKNVVVLHRGNRKLLEYQRVSWFDIFCMRPHDKFWKKENNTWRLVHRPEFKYDWDVSHYRLGHINLSEDEYISGRSMVEDDMVRWDVMTNVVARAISYDKQQLWTLNENVEAVFTHAYEFKDSGFQFLVLVFRVWSDSSSLYYKAFIKSINGGWIVAPGHINKHVIARAKQLVLWADINA